MFITKMKKNLIYIGLFVGFNMLILSCKDIAETDIIPKQFLDGYNLDFIDYAALPKNSEPEIQKYFTGSDPAKDYLPQWLMKNIFQVVEDSWVTISYDYNLGNRPTYLQKYDNGLFLVEYKDYMNVWGIPYVNSLSPSKSPSIEIPKILKSKVLNSTEGDKMVVEYNYSGQEPYTITNNNIYYVNEDFSSSNSNINNLLDWENTSRNATRTWALRTYSSTYFTAMATANGIVDPNITSLDSWLISKELDLTQAVDPKFSFDLGMGFYSNESFFSVYVTSSYELGEKLNLSEWDDISGLFNLPHSTTDTGYGPLIKYGEVSLKNYVGKKIRLGFRYTGKINSKLNRSTSYELDNIVVHEIANQTFISSSKTYYDAYEYTGGKWTSLSGNKYVLQPEDYSYLNVKAIGKDKAAVLIPNILKRKSDLSTTEKIVVIYKSSINNSYSDEFEFIDGVWTQVSPKEIIKKKDEYRYNNNSWSYIKTID